MEKKDFYMEILLLFKQYEERLKDQVFIDIKTEKEEAFRNLDTNRNPYHLVFQGPEE